MDSKKIIPGYLAIFIFAVFIALSFSSAFAKKTPKVLIFSKTKGYHHTSIEVGIPAIKKIGAENGFDVDTTTDGGKFTVKNLKQYKSVIFLSTTGDVLNEEQQNEFEKYIKAGGGFVGIHAASDCEYDWPWYGNLVGAYFLKHPAQQDAVLKITDSNHISTKHLPLEWKRKDEWYNFKWMATDLHVLIKIDENSYNAGPGKMGENHPMAWYHNFDGGRAFYTELGHTNESYQEELFLKHILGGIKYAMGINK